VATRCALAAVAVTAAVTLLTSASPARAQGVDLPAPAVDAREVDQAIRRMVDYLYGAQNDRGHWEMEDNPAAYKGHEAEERLTREFGGTTALCVLALLYAGESPQNEKLARAVKWLAEIQMTGTYAVSLRTSVWSKLNDPKYRRLLLKDAAWLIDAMTTDAGDVPGSFSYTRLLGGLFGDFSNTQYGVLGLRDAALRGVEIPPKYWQAIEQRMIDTQGADGGWGYQPWIVSPPAKNTYGNMTVGGLANLYITLERLIARFEGPFNGRSARGCGMRKPPEAIDKALAWLDTNLPVDFGKKPVSEGTPNPTSRGHGMGNGLYYLYGLERCGHASGRKTFGGLDWFQEGAARILQGLRASNHWSRYSHLHGPEVNTSWAILFLSKGQAPVLYNKLDTGADWNNKLRDMANLSRFMGDELEQRINWQVVDADDSVETWLDAPILFFSGHDIPPFTDDQKRKLRLYTDSGGTLVAQACCSRPEFVRGFQRLAAEVWPEWELQMLDRKHPVFGFHYEIRGRVPRMMHIHDGSRSCVFLVCQGMAGAWNQDMRMQYPTYFQLGLNLARYASDKRNLRSRLSFYCQPVLRELAAEGKPVPQRPAEEAAITVADYPTDGRRLTSIRGMRHLAELLDEAANVKVSRPVFTDHDLSGLDRAAVLHMSGHHTFAVSDENLEKLRAFVERGGLIWADAECGREAFNESFARFLERLLPGAVLKDVPADDPLITGRGLPREGFDAAKVRYKQALRTEKFQPVLKEVARAGRRVIVYSPLDLTCGLDGHDCAGGRGPERNDALKVAANLVLSALPAGAPPVRATPAPQP